MVSVNLEENGSIWDFKGKLDFVDQWFMMSSPIPMATTTIIYVLFVLKIGPEYMKTRRPYDLKNAMVIYNIMQVFISSYLFYLSSSLMLPNGFVTKTCLLEKEETRHSLTTIMYYYFLAKVTELLDTVFFILRKKDNQITFLHVYHHTMMVITCWSILKYEPTYPTIFLRNINSFVHMIMYAYYGLSLFPSLTKYLWWKKYLTKLQLVQFILVLIHLAITFTTSECAPSYLLCFTIGTNGILYIFLFGKFYVNSYSKKDNLQVNGKDKDKFKNFEVTGLVRNGISKSDRNGVKNGDIVNRKKLMNGKK